MVKEIDADWMPTGEAAAALGLTADRVRRLIASGALDSRRIGGRYVVRRGDVEAQLSDVAHFGAGAAILPMRTSSAGGERWLGFSATPSWLSETHLLNALAMIEEQTLAIARLVDQYIERYVAPLLADPERADREGQVFGWASEAPDEPTEEEWTSAEGPRPPASSVVRAVGIAGLDVGITGDTLERMDTVTIRDLRNHGGDVVGRVEAGQRITVTRDGRPVAELRPLRSRGVSAAALLERWRRLPAVDPGSLRRDVDALVDQAL